MQPASRASVNHNINIMKALLKITVLLFFLSPVADAQTAEEVLTKSGNAFRENEHLSMEVAMYNYASASSPGVLVGRGMMHRDGDSYYSKFMNDEMISNRNSTVILNHDAKSMYYFRGERHAKKQQGIISPDSLAANGDSVTLAGMENGCHKVVIYHKRSYYVRTEMLISAETFLPSKITYFHAPASDDFTTDVYKTEILYEKISFEKPDGELFSEDKYVEKKNGTWIPAAAYRNYKLIISENPEQ
jgi:hypothetical protein